MKYDEVFPTTIRCGATISFLSRLGFNALKLETKWSVRVEKDPIAIDKVNLPTWHRWLKKSAEYIVISYDFTTVCFRINFVCLKLLQSVDDFSKF